MKKTITIKMAHPEEAEDIFDTSLEFDDFSKDDYYDEPVPQYEAAAKLFSFRKFDDDVVLYYDGKRIGKTDLAEIPSERVCASRVLVGSYKTVELDDLGDEKTKRGKFKENVVEITLADEEEPPKQEAAPTVPETPAKKKKKGIVFIVFAVFFILCGLASNNIPALLIFFALGGLFIYLFIKKNKEGEDGKA